MHIDSDAVRGFRKWSFLAAGVLGLLPLSSQAQEAPLVPPNVVFLLDNNESMQDFPQYLPEVNGTVGSIPDPWANGPAGRAVGTGCSDPALVAAMSWFDKDSTDSRRNGSIPFDADPDFSADPQFFNPNQFYQSRGSRVAWQVDEYPASMSWDFRSMLGQSDAMMGCFNALDWNNNYWGSPLLNQCVSCLTTKGWWRGPIADPIRHGPKVRPDLPARSAEAMRKWVVSGRVLNVRPPKFVVARKVLKDFIASRTDFRMAVATLGPDSGWFDPPQMMEPMRPACAQSLPTVDAVALDRPALMRAVNKVVFRNTDRSTGEALFGLGGYFSSQVVDNKWQSWFMQPLNPGWGWPGGYNGGTVNNPYTGQRGSDWGYHSEEWLKWSQPWETLSDDRKSVCAASQSNAVIVLTDGSPRYDNSVPITKMMDLLIAQGATHQDGTPLTFDPSYPEWNTAPGGVNYCDLFEKAPGVRATKEDCDYTDYNWPTGLARTNKNFMDDVAFFLANMDLRDDLQGNQSVRTYVIDYGSFSTMNQSIACAGKGMFYPVSNPHEMRQAFQYMIGGSEPEAAR
jgi:type IV pilus assembly protein PilY1